MSAHRPVGALPLSPLTTRELRSRLADAEFVTAARAALVAERVDSTQQRANSYEIAHILAAAREYAAYDVAFAARYTDRSVAA